MIREHTEVRYVVRCDECGDQHRTAYDGFGTFLRAREEARASGWTTAPNPLWDWNRPIPEQQLDLCPRCTPSTTKERR